MLGQLEFLSKQRFAISWQHESNIVLRIIMNPRYCLLEPLFLTTDSLWSIGLNIAYRSRSVMNPSKRCSACALSLLIASCWLVLITFSLNHHPQRLQPRQYRGFGDFYFHIFCFKFLQNKLCNMLCQRFCQLKAMFRQGFADAANHRAVVNGVGNGVALPARAKS